MTYDFNEDPFAGRSNGHAGNGHDHTAGATPKFELGEWDFGAANIVASELPPRGWLLGTWLCRQFVSSLVGDGAAGKTSQRILCALALATGRANITGEHVFERVPVLFVCFEDGELELKKRIAAAMLHHKISNTDIKDHLFVRAITNSDLKLATTDDFNKTERGPLIAALDTAIERRQAGAVFLDPLVKTHSVPENSNSAMDVVITILAELAISRDVAVDVPQHVSKGLPDPGNADRGRGASAVKDGGRLVYTLCGMTAKEAENFNLDPSEHGSYVRVDHGKVNLASRADAHTKWFRFVGVKLGNTWDPRYPNGDTVGTLEPWTPPDAFEGMTKSTIAEIFDQLRAGPGDGEFYSPHGNAQDRWAGTAIINIAGKDKEQAKRILRGWLKSTMLTEKDYTSPKNKDTRKRVVVNEVKAADYLGALYRPPGKAEAPTPAEAPKNGEASAPNKYDVLGRIFTAIERGLPPNGDSSVSLMITQAQKRTLRERGYDDEQIREMTPASAHQLLGLSGDGVERYYSADATSERAAWRIVQEHHRPGLDSTAAQALVTKWIRDGVLVSEADGLHLNPLVKQMRGAANDPSAGPFPWEIGISPIPL